MTTGTFSGRRARDPVRRCHHRRDLCGKKREQQLQNDLAAVEWRAGASRRRLCPTCKVPSIPSFLARALQGQACPQEEPTNRVRRRRRGAGPLFLFDFAPDPIEFEFDRIDFLDPSSSGSPGSGAVSVTAACAQVMRQQAQAHPRELVSLCTRRRLDRQQALARTPFTLP